MSDFPRKLRKIYDDTNGGLSVGMFVRSPNQTPHEFTQELNNLEYSGYFTVIDRAIGCAHVQLTPKGIKFCEQIIDGLFD